MISKLYFRGVSFIGIAEVIAKTKGLIIMPLLTRHFGALDYGVWSQVLAIVVTFSPLIALGTDQALYRIFSGKSREEQNQALSALLLFLCVSTMIIGGFVHVAEEFIVSIFFGEPSAEYFEMIPFAIVFMSIGVFANVMTGWLRMQGEVGAFAATIVFQALLGVIAIASLLIIDGNVRQLVIFIVLAEGILLLGLVFHHSIRYGWYRPEIKIIPRLLHYGLPLLPAAYAMWGLNWIDRLFLVAYRDLAEIGIYSLVYGLGLVFVPLLSRPFRAMYPTQSAELFNQGRMKDLQKLFNMSAGGMIVLLVPAVAGIALVSKNMILTLATPEFLTGAPIIGIITAAYALNSLSSFYDVSLGLAYRQVWTSVSMVAAVLVNIGLNALWIPEYGMHGAAWATLAAFIVKFTISYTISLKTKVYETSLGLLWKVACATAFMTMGMLIVHEWIDSQLLQSWHKLLVSILIGATLYGLALLVLWRRARFEIRNFIYTRLGGLTG